jgi:hypothetical protein
MYIHNPRTTGVVEDDSFRCDWCAHFEQITNSLAPIIATFSYLSASLSKSCTPIWGVEEVEEFILVFLLLCGTAEAGINGG